MLYKKAMSVEFATALPPISGAKMETLNVTQEAFMEMVTINNIIVENAIVNNLEVEDTLIYNKITNGIVTIENDRIIGLAPPTEPADAANMEFVDAKSWKDTVRVATTVPIILAGTQTIDGVSLSVDERVLVKNQALTSNNGIYIVKAGIWERSQDATTTMLASASAMIVQEGTTNASKLFFCPTIGANFGGSITFSELSGGGGGVIAGSALSFSGAVLNVNTDGTTIQVSGGNALELVNDDLTIGVGSGITGGGLVALGGTSTAIAVDSTVIRTSGGQTIAGTLDVTGTFTTDTIEASTATATISLYDNTVTGPITIAGSSTSSLTLGTTTTTVSIPGGFSIDNITGTTPTTNVSLYNTTTTGQIDIGTVSTGVFNIGGASSNINMDGSLTVDGTITNDNIEGSSPSTSVSLFDTTTSGTVNVATSTTGIVNIGGSASTSIFEGTVNANTIQANGITDVVSLYDSTTSGAITLGASSTSNIDIGSSSSTTNVNGILATDIIDASSPTTSVSLFDNTTTGTLDIGTSSTGTFNIGGASSNINMDGSLTVDGTITNDNIEGSAPTTSVSLFDTTTSGTVNVATSSTGIVNIGSATATTIFEGTVNTNTIQANGITDVVSLYDSTTSGAITLGASSTSNIDIGSSSSTTNVNGILATDIIDASSTTSNVSLFDNTITGTIDIGTASTGTFNLGGASSTIDVAGDLNVVSPPASNTSAVNRGFVDSKTNKDSVRCATTIAGTLATSFEDGDVIDGVTLATGDRILIKNQATGSENGIYTVNVTGAPTRSNDAVTGMQASGTSMIVQEGTANGDKLFFCDTSPEVDFGSIITFTQISGGGGGGTPSSPNSSIQFNNSSSFGGTSNFTWSNSAQTFTVTGQQKIATAPLGTFSGTPSASGSILDVQGHSFTIASNAALGVFTSFSQPTFTASASPRSVTDMATVYIENEPNTNASGGATPTFTKKYSLLIDSGKVSFKDPTPSSSTTSGALVVTGGIGCGNDIRATGNVFATGFVSTSDAVMKYNINPLEDSLDRLKKIETYEYNMKGFKHKQFGVIAQQLQQAGLENMVSNEPMSDHMYVNYIQLIPLLINSVKELSEELVKLRKQNNLK